jgi:hypothetical protein
MGFHDEQNDESWDSGVDYVEGRFQYLTAVWYFGIIQRLTTPLH